MKCVKTQDAVGHVLCHDITQIIKDVKKGTAFRKGHIVTEEDIPVLLSLGKDNLYIWEKTEGILHENEAAEYLRDICMNENMIQSEVKEGKIEFLADKDGLLKIDKEKLLELNMLGEIIVSTIHGNFPVKKGDKVGATRVIPLVIDENKIIEAENLIKDKIIEVKEIKNKKTFAITTGNEVYSGRIKDAFGPVLKEKLKEFNIDLERQVILPDDKEKIIEEIKRALDEGAELILCTGGMSVDPDDVTPTAIKECGGELITYGSPVLPGAMLLLAYYNDVPIIGIPSCAMYSKRTALDLVLPRVLADERLTLRDIAEYGHGGLCLNCPVCTFPHCSFGK